VAQFLLIVFLYSVFLFYIDQLKLHEAKLCQTKNNSGIERTERASQGPVCFSVVGEEKYEYQCTAISSKPRSSNIYRNKKAEMEAADFQLIFFFYDHSSVCENLSKLFSLMNERKY